MVVAHEETGISKDLIPHQDHLGLIVWKTIDQGSILHYPLHSWTGE